VANVYLVRQALALQRRGAYVHGRGAVRVRPCCERRKRTKSGDQKPMVALAATRINAGLWGGGGGGGVRRQTGKGASASRTTKRATGTTVVEPCRNVAHHVLQLSKCLRSQTCVNSGQECRQRQRRCMSETRRDKIYGDMLNGTCEAPEVNIYTMLAVCAKVRRVYARGVCARVARALCYGARSGGMKVVAVNWQGGGGVRCTAGVQVGARCGALRRRAGGNGRAGALRVVACCDKGQAASSRLLQSAVAVKICAGE